MSSLNPIGIPFIELPAVDSTNNYAMGLVREAMAQHGTAVFAHTQNRGKGQRAKHWESEDNKNIALSMIIDPGFLGQIDLFLISMAAAVSCFQLINRYIPDEVKIKWPNDIYWRDRKAAGILIENIWQQQTWRYCIIGIGININQVDFGGLETRAVSLKQVTGKDYTPVELARELCSIFNDRLKELQGQPQNIISTYRDHLYKKNERARLKKDNRVFEAIIRDVTTNGQLVVQHAIEERFDVGEVEWVV